MVHGVSAQYFQVKNFTVDKGEVFTSLEDKTCQRVVVLGSQVSQTLFENRDPVGETLWIGRIPFTVIGTLKSKAASRDPANEDAQVMIPINTALRRIFNIDYLKRIFIEVNDRDKMKMAENEIIQVLRERHRLDARGKENDFTVDNQLTDIQASESASRSFTWLIVGVSAVALFVGGIGILAVMLLSVKERNPEIGLRMALGAKRRDIVYQFLAESALLGLLGGVAGFVAGSVLALTVGYFTQWATSISPEPVIISLAFSVVIGLVFGVIPARKASQADPISALQKE